MPLTALAHAFARFGTGHGLATERAKAAARLRAACAAQPYYVAGTGRFCTEIMKLFGARVLVKTGAEGVFCGALPEQGLGIALKCDDGATRAAEVAMAAMIARFLPLSDDERAALDRFVRPELRNWNGIEVGGVAAGGSPDRHPGRPVSALRALDAHGSPDHSPIAPLCSWIPALGLCPRPG